ncbi:hypothetical protein DMN91_009885 [Ooceraea biroi]|uniref:TNFR-Cys domain-containing protein n=1 Tax=Ooceraea biroi TaxID=2015173 RepID=A0A3L8DCP5_OOCBI|nr:hypothetical protein DMN91_009885 [Ooceraea biroi]
MPERSPRRSCAHCGQAAERHEYPRLGLKERPAGEAPAEEGKWSPTRGCRPRREKEEGSRLQVPRRRKKEPARYRVGAGEGRARADEAPGYEYRRYSRVRYSVFRFWPVSSCHPFIPGPGPSQGLCGVPCLLWVFSTSLVFVMPRESCSGLLLTLVSVFVGLCESSAAGGATSSAQQQQQQQQQQQHPVCKPGLEFWSADRAACWPCTRCAPEFTLSPCAVHKDAICGPFSALELDWSFLSSTRKSVPPEAGDGSQRRLEETVTSKMFWRFPEKQTKERPVEEAGNLVDLDREKNETGLEEISARLNLMVKAELAELVAGAPMNPGDPETRCQYLEKLLGKHGQNFKALIRSHKFPRRPPLDLTICEHRLLTLTRFLICIYGDISNTQFGKIVICP